MRETRWPTGVILAAVLLAGGVVAAPVPVEAQDRRPPEQPAARAVPRPAAQRARPARRPIPARPLFLGSRFHRPYPYFGYYGAFYGPYAGPYAGAYAGPYGYGPYAFQYYGAYDYTGSVRLEVEPRETEVYVDGYYTGIVDSYDGFLQRLRLPPGQHDIELYLEGYESLRHSLYLVPGETYRVRHLMQPLADGAPQPPRPEPVAAAAPAAGARTTSPVPLVHPVPGDRFGTLVVRIRPVDATVTVDGEAWVGHEGLGELVLDLGPGMHSLEVSREGHRTYRADVEVMPGAQTAVNVSLPRQEEP